MRKRAIYIQSFVTTCFKIEVKSAECCHSCQSTDDHGALDTSGRKCFFRDVPYKIYLLIRCFICDKFIMTKRGKSGIQVEVRFLLFTAPRIPVLIICETSFNWSLESIGATNQGLASFRLYYGHNRNDTTTKTRYLNIYK